MYYVVCKILPNSLVKLFLLEFLTLNQICLSVYFLFSVLLTEITRELNKTELKQVVVICIFLMFIYEKKKYLIFGP